MKETNDGFRRVQCVSGLRRQGRSRRSHRLSRGGRRDPGPGRCAERRHRPRRRPRVLRPRLLRLGDRHAEHRRHRAGRDPLRQLPRHAVVLTDTGRADDGPQRPCRRHGLRRQHRPGLPRLHGRAARQPAEPRRGVPGQRLRHRGRSASGTWPRTATCTRPAIGTRGRCSEASTSTTGSWKRSPTSTTRIACTTATASYPSTSTPTATTSPTT